MPWISGSAMLLCILRNAARNATGSGRRAGLIPIAGLIILLFAIAPKSGYCEESVSIIEDLRLIEASDIKCSKLSDQYYGYVEGHIPILISAPHGTKHYSASEGRWRAKDACTSSMAIMLGRLTGAHVIYAKYKTTEDPNCDEPSRYKDFLERVVRENGIRFVMDLHGAGRNRPFKIDVGTMGDETDLSSCPTYKPIIAEAFRGFGDRVFNKRFQGKNTGTITNFARNHLGVEAAQFEINARYRIIKSADPSLRARPSDVNDLMGRFRDMIININAKIESSGKPSCPQTIGSGGPASGLNEARIIRNPQSTRPNT
jgi:hypothetical protein